MCGRAETRIRSPRVRVLRFQRRRRSNAPSRRGNRCCRRTPRPRPRAMIELDGHRQGADRRGRRRAPGRAPARPARGGLRGGRASRTAARCSPVSSRRPARHLRRSTSGCPTPTGATSARRCARAASRRPSSSSPRATRSIDRVTGFDAGGDDYVTKPFALRRARRAAAGAAPPQPARHARSRGGGLRLDPVAHAASAGGDEDPADADRVPPARAAARAARRGGPTARARPRRLAARRDRAATTRSTRTSRASRRKLEQLDGAPEIAPCTASATASDDQTPAPAARRAERGRGEPSLRSSIGFNLILAHTLDSERALRPALARRERNSRSSTHRAGASASAKRSNARSRYRVWVFAGQSSDRAASRASAVDHAGAPRCGRARRLPRRRATRTCGCTAARSSPRGHARRQRSSSRSRVAPYEQTRRTALISSLVFGDASCSCSSQSPRGGCSRPRCARSTRMTRQAATWSERDLDRRFELGEPHDELTELAATLDGLLDRLAASLRHEQRFSAELSHELRTPLSRVLAETELALRRERAPEEYRDDARAGAPQRRAAEPHDRRARSPRRATRPARRTAPRTRSTSQRRAASVCAGLAAERSLDFEIARPDRPIRIGVEADSRSGSSSRCSRTRAATARARSTSQIERVGSSVRYSVSDDGPGVEDAERERIFEPGVRGRGRGTGPARGSASRSRGGSRRASPARSRPFPTPRAVTSSSGCRAADGRAPPLRDTAHGWPRG